MQHKSALMIDGISEEAVTHYLESHPEFFERHAQLLATLRLPHQAGGTAVSLVEKQVAILRQRNRNLDRKLAEFVDVARSNDALAAKVHGLALRLLSADGLVEVLRCVEVSLREDFAAQQSVLVLFHPGAETAKKDLGRFLRVPDRHDAAIRSFDSLLERGKPRCGQIRDSQRDFLFGADTNEIGSVALIPLGERSELGILAIGSSDAAHFHPTMSTDFLLRIGELVSAAIYVTYG